MIVPYEITRKNLNIAIEIQNAIFPKFSAKENYIESIENKTTNKYYLLSDGTDFVGVIGIYFHNIDTESAWLGWFGILDNYRKKGYGSEALSLFENAAREKGFKYARLYTDKVNNDIALSFYKAMGYTFEDYINRDDPASIHFPIMIGSKTLCGSMVEPWNNKNIELTEQIRKQDNY